MALFEISRLKRDLSGYLVIARRHNLNPTAEDLIRTNNRRLEDSRVTQFDIFLSHAFKDAEIVAGIMIELSKMGYTVYVDWIFDTHLSRDFVTKATAELLITRMKQSASLFYATTLHATHSKWMPWELGFKHGQNGKCAILPVKEESNASDVFIGQEYLGIYEKVVKEANTLYICPETTSSISTCKPFNLWANINPKTAIQPQTLSSFYIVF